MLSQDRISAVVVSKDLQKSQEFYGQRLGMKLSAETITNHLIFEGKGGTTLLIYTRPAGNTGADQTLVRFWTDDIEAEVKELDERGVVFEEYDFPNFKTVNRIGDSEYGRSAWLKDPDGNTLQIFQPASSRQFSSILLML
jgi:catechol 2,3-dioxygenase-like lactoylglutathione lyase family enzyme